MTYVTCKSILNATQRFAGKPLQILKFSTTLTIFFLEMFSNRKGNTRIPVHSFMRLKIIIMACLNIT